MGFELAHQLQARAVIEVLTDKRQHRLGAIRQQRQRLSRFGANAKELAWMAGTGPGKAGGHRNRKGAIAGAHHNAVVHGQGLQIPG